MTIDQGLRDADRRAQRLLLRPTPFPKGCKWPETHNCRGCDVYEPHADCPLRRGRTVDATD